ncbi:FAST kinase domain-containing protein 4-like [Tubulanus polymorphus]|uniref:FAST kinase domain-containing protein 4-like n=1 Tax=Tubulanus polymorphus TaxID=672921 RepID=UPI003DA4BADB
MIRLLSLGGRQVRRGAIGFYRAKTTPVSFYSAGPTQVRPLVGLTEDLSAEAALSSPAPAILSTKSLGYKFAVTDGIEEKIRAARTPSELFAALVGELSVGDVVLTFERLVDFKRTGSLDAAAIDAITRSPNYETLAAVVDRSVVDLDAALVMRALKSLLELFPSRDDYLIESLEQHVLWLLPRVAPTLFVQALDAHRDARTTPTRRRVYDAALKTLDRRWAEIANPRDIVTLMYRFGLDDRALMAKLEERALDVADRMGWKDLYRVVYILAKKRTRNTPLLRALLYHMNRFPVNLNPVQLQNLMYACALFKLYDENLFEKVSRTVADSLTTRAASVAVVTRLMTSFSVLRWRDERLLEAYVEFLASRADELSERDVAAMLLTLANLNFKPDDAATLNELTDRCSGMADPRLWLSVVWSKVVLGIASNRDINSVLDSQFISQLLEDGSCESHQATSHRLKLHNINCAAHMLQSDYTGAKLSKDFIEASQLQVPVRTTRYLTNLVVKALSNIAPIDKYLKSGVMSTCACYIDAEMLVNDSGEPQPLTEQTTSNQHHRLAIRVYEFPDLTWKTHHPIGLHDLTSRLLAKEGYKVIEIPYFEFKEMNTVVKQVQYLEEKIKNRIKNCE